MATLEKPKQKVNLQVSIVVSLMNQMKRLIEDNNKKTVYFPFILLEKEEGPDQ